MKLATILCRTDVRAHVFFVHFAVFFQDRAAFDEDSLPGLNEIVMDEELSAAILKASRHSMGMDASPVDMSNIVTFCERMVKLAEYRRDLYAYLVDKVRRRARQSCKHC